MPTNIQPTENWPKPKDGKRQTDLRHALPIYGRQTDRDVGRHILQRAKSTQDSPITTGKTETDAAGNVTEHGDQPSDYVKRDKQGRLLEFSINNEMDGYVDSRKYTYDEEGRVVKIEVSDGDTLTYHYVKQDERNWTGLLIVSGETPIGAVDRKIIYY